MIFSLKNGKQAAEKIADYLGLTKLFQGVVDTNNAVKDINSGKTNLNQKGLDGYAAVLANAALANAGLNAFLVGFNKLPNTPINSSAKAYLTAHSFSFNLGIATTSVPLAAALYKEGRYSDAVSALLSGGSAALGAINDAQSLNPKVTPTELKTNLAQIGLALAAMAEEKYKFTDQAIDALSHLIEDMDNALKDMWQSFKDFDGNKKWNDFLDNFADWFLPKATGFNDWFSDFENWIGDQFDWVGDDWKDWFGINRTGLFHIYDPLVLDLDGDGIELVNANGWNGVQFDFNGNGIQTATQWVKADDGLLVWDRNNNGVIDDGSELFGEDTPHRFLIEPVTDGFTALRTVESHPDGEINAKDHEWKNLKVWRDLNQDGKTQKGELFSLNELGITGLDLNTGLAKGTSTFTTQDGKKQKLADVNFNRDTVHSEYKEHIALSEAQLKLPNLHGVGMLRDLREAANNEFFAQYTTAFQAA